MTNKRCDCPYCYYLRAQKAFSGGEKGGCVREASDQATLAAKRHLPATSEANIEQGQFEHRLAPGAGFGLAIILGLLMWAVFGAVLGAVLVWGG